MKKFFIVVVLIAAFLRLWRLEDVPVSLFGDELDVGYHAYSILNTGKDYYGNFIPLHLHSLAEWRTPLYIYSTIPTVAIFGISALGVRLPAAIFGILGVAAMYFLVKKVREDYLGMKSGYLEVVASLLLAISPWHIQYSRAGFEVTQMLFFLLLGLYFFFFSLGKRGKYLWLATALFMLMPWVYSTAKMFTPILLVSLLLIFKSKILPLPRRSLVYSAITGLALGLPLIFSIIVAGGGQRFGYIGVFSDPTIETEIGARRQQLALIRGESGFGLNPSLQDRLYSNKFVFVGDKILTNYFQAFSTDFLFNKGDLNLRHSINDQGQFYRLEAVALIVGAVAFFSSAVNKKVKIFMAAWVLGGVVPAAVTRDGGTHATRLILILPPLIFLISYGWWSFVRLIPKRIGLFFFGLVAGLYILSLAFYQQSFWNVNPWESERWWHAGWKESVAAIKEFEDGYEKVIVTSADEPPWIFFAGWYEYPPAEWQNNFPLGNDVELEGIGKVSHIGKFYFGSPEGGLYEWGKVLGSSDLYLVSAKEVNVNLIVEPERTPGDLILLKSIAYPSGEPAFYLFSGRNEK